jgi:predicted O-linked N-acetylglucosamine transferase (SPINDLY family)
VLYQRAHEADTDDVTTAADYGRYLVTKMVVVHAELSNMQDKGEAAGLSLRNERVVIAADGVLSKALEKDPKNIVVLYNLALLYQKFKSNPNNNSEEHIQRLDNVEKAEFLLKRLLTETQGKHLAGMQQLGRVMVDKFKALKTNNNTSDMDAVSGNASGTNSEIIDTVMDCYENTMNMKLEKAKTDAAGTATATVQTALLEYLKIVSSFSTTRQKMRTIAFIEGFMKRCQAQVGGISAVLPHEIDIRQMMKNMEVVINKGKEQKDKNRR